jgi:hypothetical protein
MGCQRNFNAIVKKPSAMPANAKPQLDFDTIYAKLKALMQPYEKGSLKSVADKDGNYVLIGPATEASRGKELWFGAVRKGKAYVSYHLMAVYAHPQLLDSLSPELKKRMQGKSCFNFKTVDEKLFKELAKLTKKSYSEFKKAKLIK